MPFDHLNLVAPYIADLKTNSDARVAKSPDFDYLRQDIAYYKKRVDDTTVSLNEAARLKEKDDLKAQDLARKKDLESRKAGRDKELELTLDMVDNNLPAAPPEVEEARGGRGRLRFRQPDARHRRRDQRARRSIRSSTRRSTS